MYEFKEQRLHRIQSASGVMYETKDKQWFLGSKANEVFIEYKGKIIFRGKEIDEKKTIDNSSWIYKGKIINNALIAAIDESEITLDFKEGIISGNVGCNNYFGEYKIDENIKISIAEIGTTLAMCSKEISKQEDVYLSVLKKVIKKKITTYNELHLYFSDTDYLVFNKKPEVPIKLYKGKLVIGHEVSSIEVQDYKLGVWFSDPKNLVEKKYYEITKNKEPYTPVYVEVKGKMLPKAIDGFAEEYGNVLEVTELISIKEIEK